MKVRWKPDWSSTGRARVVAWTVLAPLVVAAFVVCVDFTVLGPVTTGARATSIMMSVILPLLIAPPLFLFFTVKQRELAIAKEKLHVAATTDSLTGCLNRGAFIERAEALMSDRSQAHGALLVIDADRFKVINDRYGHHVGDEALVAIADAIRGVLRRNDLFGRLGGEEFGVLLPGVDYGHASLVAERIRDAIACADLSAGGNLPELTVSVGGALFESEMEFTDLFRIADRRLYSAKDAGRNRIDVRPVNAPAEFEDFAAARRSAVAGSQALSAARSSSDISKLA